MTALLDINDLRTWFPIKRGILSRTVGHIHAVDGVSLKIKSGETLALVGESGCGKTTVARTIMRLDKAHSGSVYFKGTDILNMTEKKLRSTRRHLQMVFQDPFSSLNPRMMIIDILTEGMIEHGLIKSREKVGAATQLLADVGLGKEALYRFPHEFSGGQRQRISIARAISLHPELVLCDEAVSALDVSVQAQIINLLMDLRDEHHLSYLFISHDLGVVRQLADVTAVMYLGQIVEIGATEDVIDHPLHPYTQALVSAVPRIEASSGRSRIVLSGDVPSAAKPPTGCRFHTRCPWSADVCREQTPALASTTAGDKTERQVACLRQAELSKAAV